MDVISLLNSGAAAAAAAEQQKRIESTRSTPTRNRTPWDAGGYSLPINTIALAPQSTPPQQIHHDDIRHAENQTPTSPKQHKFSDSRSSLSSFTSSLQSTTHSRFSSMSTVNSVHPLNCLSLDSLSPKLRNVPHALELSTIDSSSEARLSKSLSPTGSLDTLALVAEHHPFSQQPSQQSSEVSATTPVIKKSSSHSSAQSASPGRPSSPSDAILIKRSAVPILRVNTGDADLKRADPQPQTDENFLSAPLDNFLQQPLLHIKSHQRSFSAPTFWPIMGDPNMRHDHASGIQTDNNNAFSPNNHSEAAPASAIDNTNFSLSHRTEAMNQTREELGCDSTYNTGFALVNNPNLQDNFKMAINPIDMRAEARLGPRAELTPPSSHHPDHPSPTGESLAYPTPDTPPVVGPESEVACMFVDSCQTGSQLRKAISHILGRNKLCTRQIPKEIWVHFCRKHYQRSRYRNPKEFAKLQCDLLQKQIRRIHDWSRENAEAGRPGVVQDWELTIRKREQKRLDELNTTNRKRRADVMEDDEDDENNTAASANHNSQYAVPDWLLQCCRKGYTTREILEVFNRLHVEVLADQITHFPDIEILPNITVDHDVPKSPKGYAKRGGSANHRRTQSTPIGQSSLISTWNEEYKSSIPQQKKRRPNSRMEENFEDRPMLRSRQSDRPMDTGRRMVQPSHRPVFPDIRENHREEQYGENHVSHYSHSPSPYQIPLPAPTPQRSTGHSMAAHLENNNGYPHAPRRPLHIRSQSDVSGFGPNRMEYTSPSAGYGMPSDYQARQPQFQEQRPQPNGYTYPPPQYSQPQYRDEPSGPSRGWSEMQIHDPMPSHGHQRVQSTPMVQSSYTAPSAAYGRRPSQPINHYTSHQQRNNTLPPAPRRASETDDIRDLYGVRR